MPIFMNVFDYSRWRCCSESAVYKAVRTHRISRRQKDGLIEVGKADADWERNTNVLMQRTAIESPEPEIPEADEIHMTLAEWDAALKAGFPSVVFE